MGLAVDVREDFLFFSDVARHHQRIARVNIQKGVAETIVTGRSVGVTREGGERKREGRGGGREVGRVKLSPFVSVKGCNWRSLNWLFLICIAGDC